MTMPLAKPAVFVDRDNTLIRDPGYLRDPGQVHLLTGVPEALQRLRSAGHPVIVVSNQSGVARGFLTEEDVAAIHHRMQALLAERGAAVDAIYYCPYLDGVEAVRAEYRVDSDLRKPKPGMLLLAAREHHIDLARSWMIGDSERDIVAGHAAGCRSILVCPNGRPESTTADHVARDLSAAVDVILNGSGDAASPSTPPPHSSSAPQHSAPPRPDAALQQIVEELRMIRRERQYTQFSMTHLAAAIAQAFALCALGWGLYAGINGADEAAKIRLLVAIAFQLLALTGFAASMRK
jgi:D-glycero-D-manno-heptose 1,7-bisphosphate phosphatase